MEQITRKSNYFTRDGFTTSEVVISVALLSAFYASVLTISSLVTSNSRSSEIRPVLIKLLLPILNTFAIAHGLIFTPKRFLVKIAILPTQNVLQTVISQLKKCVQFAPI